MKVHNFMHLRQRYCVYIRSTLRVKRGNAGADGTQIPMTTVVFPVILARKREAEQILGSCPGFSHFLITS